MATTTTPWRDELRLLVQLAVPTIIIQVGFTAPSFLTASYVGRRFGSVYLDSFLIANLTGNLFTLSLLSGLYTASDTLSPQAFGVGNYREVGLLAMRGYLGSMIIILPICTLLFLFMEQGLVAFGEDKQVAHLAARWYIIYALSLPIYALYMVTWKFLSAQNVMHPLLLASITSSCVVLPLALEIGTRWAGFLGSAVAVCVFQSAQALIVLAYLYIFRPHVKETWPSLHAWKDALQWKPLMHFFYLGMGGIVGSVEWVYWEVLSLLVGRLGTTALSAHAVATQILSVSFMLPLGLGIALAIRLGHVLPRNPQHAKDLAVATLVIGTSLFVVVALLLYIFREYLFGLFTDEPDVIEYCDRIWWKLCVYFALLAQYALNMGCATGLGMQWTLGVVTVVFLCLFGLPAVWYIGITRAQSLDVVWSLVYPPYVVMDVVLLLCFFTKDWDKVAAEISAREVVKDLELEETMLESHYGYGSMNERQSLVSVAR